MQLAKLEAKETANNLEMFLEEKDELLEHENDDERVEDDNNNDNDNEIDEFYDENLKN